MTGWRLEINRERHSEPACLPVVWLSMVCTIEDCLGKNSKAEVRWEMFLHELGPF